MVPPKPPSQRGKFRPKKPQKKVKSTSTSDPKGVDNSIVPEVVLSNPNNIVSSGRNDSGPGGRKGGRGGTGRGRGRERERGPSLQGRFNILTYIYG